MMHTIADRRRLPVWTMLQTGTELWVGVAPEFHLHYHAAEMAALALCGKPTRSQGEQILWLRQTACTARARAGFSTHGGDFAADSLQMAGCAIIDAIPDCGAPDVI
jgi:hypothetical protein